MVARSLFARLALTLVLVAVVLGSSGLRGGGVTADADTAADSRDSGGAVRGVISADADADAAAPPPPASDGNSTVEYKPFDMRGGGGASGIGIGVVAAVAVVAGIAGGMG